MVYIALSLDGYIAGPGDDLSFLDSVQVEGEDYGYNAFMQSVDTVLMGRKTYDKVMSFGIELPHESKEWFVFSHSKHGTEGAAQFVNTEVSDFVRHLRNREGGTIFVDGGATLIQYLIRADLVDRFVLSYVPLMLGAGVPLFAENTPTQEYELTAVRHYASSLVQAEFRRIRKAMPL